MLHRVGTITLELENQIKVFFVHRHLIKKQFQKFNAGPLYIQLRKLQNTEYKTLYTD